MGPRERPSPLPLGAGATRWGEPNAPVPRGSVGGLQCAVGARAPKTVKPRAQQNALADQTSYATLTVSYQLPAVAAIEVQAEGWDAGRVLDEATATLVGVLQALAGAGIWLLVVWVPILVMFAVAAGIVAWLLRRFGVLERAVRSSPPASAGD